jgi:epoxyqueuosine reductase
MHARDQVFGQPPSEARRRRLVRQARGALYPRGRAAKMRRMSHVKTVRWSRRMHAADLAMLAATIKAWGRELGFQAVGIADTDLSVVEPRLEEWLASGFAGELDYMRKHGAKRTRPASLVPGTLRVISARMDYRPGAADSEAILADGGKAFVARYALGRDYHKVLRARLRRLAERIRGEVGEAGYRVFVDSAPVMEVELARKSGLGWRGKHTLLLAREAGSFFFLGEIYTDLPLPVDAPAGEHCGSCAKCIEVCPTRAIVAPYVLDARRCISYLTIELKGSIPVELRPLIGNRVFGCDDCQLVCPWNRYARFTAEPDFRVRNGLDCLELLELFSWSDDEFRERLSGSAILRIGYERWSRNLAVALGNAPTGDRIVAALRQRAADPSALVREHIVWALERHGAA